MNFLEKSQWWTIEQHKDYQFRKLKEILEYSYKNIVYYQKQFKKIDAAPYDIKSFKDFEEFPFLTKELVRDNINELIPIGSNIKKYNYHTTGGSTGKPLGFYTPKYYDAIEKAFMHHQWGRVGYKLGDSKVVLRGVYLKNKIFQYHKPSNSWYFSSYHLSNEFIKEMVDKLNEIKPKFIHIHPSVLWVFTKLLLENGLEITFKPNAILSGSENLYSHQRKLFTDVYKCKVFNWLGLGERTTLAGECEKNTDLHIFYEHSYVELIDNNNKIINENNMIGEIVGTNFYNFATPFIKYRSNDTAKYSVRSENCECNRKYKLFEKVEGRTQDVIILENGKMIPLVALIFAQHFLSFSRIKLMQLEQISSIELIIRIVKKNGYTPEDQNEIKNKISQITDNLLKITFDYVDEIQRTKSGKHRFLIQHLPIDYYQN